MLHQLKLSKILGVYVSFLFLVGCSTNPPIQQFSKSADPTHEINILERNISRATNEQVNVLSPDNYNKANKYLKQAKEDRDKNKENEKILNDVAIGNAWLVKANETAKKGADALPDVVDLRARALDERADIHSAKSWKKADKDFVDVGKDFEKGDFSITDEERTKLLNQYMNLELAGIKAENAELALAGSERDAAQELSNDVSEQATMSAETSRLADKVDLDEKYKTAKSQFNANEAEVLKEDDKLIIRLKGLKFPTGQADLATNSYPLMTKVETVIKSLGDAEIEVEGHTDAIGPKEINSRLSEERADAVKNYLIENGAVASANITAAGFGDEKPISTNSTSDGRAQNRRVDIVITPQ